MTDKRSVLVKWTGHCTLPVGRSEAWAVLHDPSRLQDLMPGGAKVRAARDGSRELRIAVPVGPLTSEVKVRLHCSEIDAPRSYRLGFEGSGGLAGQGKGRVKVRLESPSRGQTLLHYDVAASIEGPLAQLGAPLAEVAARALAQDFLARLHGSLLAQRDSALAA